MGARRDHPRKRFVRKLLTATCLGAVGAGAAHATPVTESTDFGNSFAERTLLSAGTYAVNGTVGFGDDDDFFQLSGLTPLAPFTVHFATAQGPLIGAEVRNSADASLGSGGFDLNMPYDVSGDVPADGILVLRTFWQEGGPYQVSVVPEPATGALLATGLGALAALRRKAAR